MDEIEMMIERDTDAGTWDIGTVPAGPSGAVLIDLSEGVTAAVDLALPSQIGLLVAEDFDTGQVRDEDLERVALLSGPDAASEVAGRTFEGLAASAQSRALLSRLAVAVDGWNHARAEFVRDLWSAEIVAAAADADARLGLAALVDRHRTAGRAAFRELASRGDLLLDAVTVEALGRLAGAIGVDVPTLRSSDDVVERSVSLDRVESARLHLGDVVDGRSRPGWLMLDPAVSSGRVFALEHAALVDWDEIDHVLRLRCHLSPRAYFPEVEAYWVRTYRSGTGTLLGLGQLDPFTGEDRTAAGETYLGNIAAAEWDDVVVDVTDQPQARTPARATRDARVASDLGRAALAAERLGLVAVAGDAWRRCAERWRTLGDEVRATAAETRTGAGHADQSPFAADLVASIRT